MIKVARLGDTLDVYVEHTIAGRPDYRAAAGADRVLWCYPQRYGHEDHLFPDAEGRVYFATDGDGDQVVFATEQGVDRLGIDH